MADFPVKWIHSGMRGVPQISGTPGALIAALDAFLLTGCAQVTALSVSVLDGVATAVLSAGEGFEKDCVIQVAGATPEALNGPARVLSATATQVTWATAAADGPASGSITLKIAPVGGWEKVFSATNVAVYRSTDVQGARCFYRVDDTGTLSARVQGFVSMSDVDTGTNPFPTEAQLAGGGHWLKSGAANAVAVPYVLAADGRTLLVAISGRASVVASQTAAPLRGFGDLLPLAPGGDVWSASVACAADTVMVTAGSGQGGYSNAASGGNAVYVARDLTGIGGGVQVGTKAYVGGTATSGADSTLGNFPSSVDGQLKYCRRYVYQHNSTSDQPPRADVPGVLHVAQAGAHGPIQRMDVISGSGDMAGRNLLAIAAVGSSLNSNPNALYLIDVTGPWR